MPARVIFRNVDLGLIVTVFGLIAISLVALYSIAAGTNDDGGFTKQIVWIGIGLAAMTVTAFIDYTRLRHLTLVIYILNIVLLLAIVFAGMTALGAQRWIMIGPFRFQPSEFTKLFVIMTLAAFLAERKGQPIGWRDVSLVLAYAAPSIVLILLQPDLGTALVVCAAIAGMLLAAGAGYKQLGALAFMAWTAGLVVIRFNLLHEYQLKRLVVFLNPDIDPLGSGYNLKQSIIAIGSGGVFGKGWLSGTQSRLDFLPPSVRHTDFIFAVIGEELGLIGGIVLLALFFFLVSRALRVAQLSRNYYGLLIGVGVVSMWIFQVLVNVGMTIGIMPITGIPLPFVSYGGSSMLMNFMAVGLLLSIYARRWR